jgi:uncharacterized protein (TIGR02301 family)
LPGLETLIKLAHKASGYLFLGIAMRSTYAGTLSGIFVQATIIAVLVATVIFATPGAGFAQDAKKPGQINTDPDIKTLPPAYNKQMLRLAEILGAVHYLRELCGADEGMLWRDQMENIVENEKPTAQRKAEIFSRFNRGFRTYREIYRKCTPSAVEAVNLYMRQGTRLAGEIPSRFGP